MLYQAKFCLAVLQAYSVLHTCLYVVGELTNSLNKTVVDNSGIAVKIESLLLKLISEVSMLYNDALCMLESFGCLFTLLNMRSVKNI